VKVPDIFKSINNYGEPAPLHNPKQSPRKAWSQGHGASGPLGTTVDQVTQWEVWYLLFGRLSFLIFGLYESRHTVCTGSVIRIP
jgi:hypothetical protein